MRFAYRALRILLSPLWRSRTLGLLSEVYFWRRWIESEGLQWQEEYRRRLDPGRPLLPHVAAYVSRLAVEPVRILDVGAGPVTVLGYRLEGKQIDITAVDVLARTYDRLWARRNVLPPVRTQFADAERLTEIFAPRSFDFVYSQNSLDHAARPWRAIEQMLEVVKPGCYVVLSHAIDEAENEGYSGLHQWNFSERDGDFIIWRPSETRNMTRELAASCQVRTERRGDSILVEIRRASAPLGQSPHAAARTGS
jgi:SAM-dependent methyltransferase